MTVGLRGVVFTSMGALGICMKKEREREREREREWERKRNSLIIQELSADSKHNVLSYASMLINCDFTKQWAEGWITYGYHA